MEKQSLLESRYQKLQKVLEAGKPTVVILMAGSSIDLTEADESDEEEDEAE